LSWIMYCIIIKKIKYIRLCNFLKILNKNYQETKILVKMSLFCEMFSLLGNLKGNIIVQKWLHPSFSTCSGQASRSWSHDNNHLFSTLKPHSSRPPFKTKNCWFFLVSVIHFQTPPCRRILGWTSFFCSRRKW